jgi:hypothetical protein
VSQVRSNTGGFFSLLLVVGIFLFWILALTGCAHNPAQSWDQANLKRNDHGCPTAIFVAPGGELQQCQKGVDGDGLIEFTTEAPAEFDTLEEAAIAAFKVIAAKPSALYYEWGGVIVKSPAGKFSAEKANTSLGGDHVQIQSDNFFTNSTIVASYHTHPCLPEHFVEYFSPQDLFEPIFFHLTVFMGDFCTGTVHEFKPGDKPDFEHPYDHGHKGEEIFLTKGTIVGTFTTGHLRTAL